MLASGIGLAAAAAGIAAAAEAPPAPVRFNEDVRPILAETCLKCQGGVKRESGLTLLYRREALEPADSGKRAIVPGKPEESELLRRVSSSDPDYRMPPRGNPLPAAAIDKLRRWIAAGAPYDVHWAYVKPEEPPLPEVRHAAWARGSLDRFILSRLEREGLEPSPEADRGTLARRAALDLTGVPPSLEELDRFLADDLPGAFERYIDRLLASPRFGERWARLWLDIARYADTQGYEKDNRRTIWRYRDWVIEAFNRDLSFDRFTIEQLAGDLLPEPTLDQLIATAFHRNTMTNTEGGTDDEEFRTAAVLDRVNSTWQAWMGTTFGCVQCHNHPYDPFRHEEYYRFLAIFNNTEDSDQPDERPVIPSPTPEEQRRVEALDAELAGLRARFEAETPEIAAARAAWEERIRGETAWLTLRPKAAAASSPAPAESKSGTTLAVLDDGSILAGGDNPANAVYTITCAIPAAASLDRIAAIRLEVLPDPSLPKGGPGRAEDGNFVLSRIGASIPLRAAAADFSQKDFPVERAIESPDPGKHGWAVQPEAGKPHWAVFAPESPAAPEGGILELKLEQLYEKPGFNLGRFRISATADTWALERARTPAAMLELARRPAAERSPEERQRLASHHRSIAAELAPLRQRIAALEAERQAVPIPTTPVLRELAEGKRRETRVFIRGSFLAPGERVEAGVPAALHPFPEGSRRDRLAAARWLVHPDNPLTARVAVNRFWEQLFGTGIVETVEDFGTQGAPPSHPELLDWLALRFEGDFRWSVKRLLREIVLSATYRQTSNADPERIARDPGNRLLGRGPRFRLEAEMVRDQALAAGGLLSTKMLGPSVMPPQPDGVWQVVYSGDNWVTSPGEDRYRRALYTFWRRTSPYPAMMAFDAVSREYCSVRRIRTSTPLQALVTLNDPAYIEAAQALARRVAAADLPGFRERAALALRLTLARPPSAEEAERLEALYRGELESFRADPEAARAMASDPLGPAPPGLDAADLAAWTVVANVLMNLDEFLTKG